MPVRAQTRIIQATFTPKNHVARKAAAMMRSGRSFFSLRIFPAMSQTTLAMTAATPACIPFSRAATTRLERKAA